MLARRVALSRPKLSTYNTQGYTPKQNRTRSCSLAFVLANSTLVVDEVKGADSVAQVAMRWVPELLVSSRHLCVRAQDGSRDVFLHIRSSRRKHACSARFQETSVKA